VVEKWGRKGLSKTRMRIVARCRAVAGGANGDSIASSSLP
jgi:hypothetical protein